MWVYEETPPASVYHAVAYDPRYTPMRRLGFVAEEGDSVVHADSADATDLLAAPFAQNAAKTLGRYFPGASPVATTPPPASGRPAASKSSPAAVAGLPTPQPWRSAVQAQAVGIVRTPVRAPRQSGTSLPRPAASAGPTRVVEPTAAPTSSSSRRPTVAPTSAARVSPTPSLRVPSQPTVPAAKPSRTGSDRVPTVAPTPNAHRSPTPSESVRPQPTASVFMPTPAPARSSPPAPQPTATSKGREHESEARSRPSQNAQPPAQIAHQAAEPKGRVREKPGAQGKAKDIGKGHH